VDEKRRKIALHKKKYVFKGEEYDKVLAELYDYCIENEVPITTHCGMDGSESYHDASFDFGHAIFWRDVLDQPRWAQLRLNLAHFGWNKEQFHRGPRSWVKEICEMLEKYPNLYTDVGHHGVVVSENVSKFQEAYKDLCKVYPIIKKRLLFGIDWHVIKRVEGFKTFKTDYINILKHNNLFTQPEIEDFLGGNAKKFLGFLKGNKNRQRLIHFYTKNNIPIPKWL
jgi:predicted TIM-barrel fold metal-dependent hydrolase